MESLISICFHYVDYGCVKLLPILFCAPATLPVDTGENPYIHVKTKHMRRRPLARDFVLSVGGQCVVRPLAGMKAFKAAENAGWEWVDVGGWVSSFENRTGTGRKTSVYCRTSTRLVGKALRSATVNSSSLT